MRDIDVRHLLGAYATGTLSPAEERRLHAAALDDQQLFDALADEELLREALADRAFRQRLQRRLRELNERSSRSLASKFADWFRQPVVLAGAAVAAMALVIGTGVLLKTQGPGGPGAGLEPATRPSGIEELPSAPPSAGTEGISLERLWDSARPSQVGGVELGLNRSGTTPRYAVGDPIRIGFRVRRAAAVALLSRSPDGAVTQVFPNRQWSSPVVRANERVVVPSAGQGYSRVAGPRGRHELRLLVFPPDVDPLQPGAAERERPVVVEQQYLVVGSQGGQE